MSYVAFRDRYEKVELAGSERAYASSLCKDLALTVIRHLLMPGVHTGPKYTPPRLLQIVPTNHDLWAIWDRFNMQAGSAQARDAYPLEEQLSTRLSVSFNDALRLTVNGEERRVPFNEVSLNTALAAGGDELRLLARLHGQCESHLWVSGHNREWLASIIESGVKKSIMRTSLLGDRSWQNVIELLRRRDDEPVVTDFSVSESFPNFGFVSDYVPSEEAPVFDEDEEDADAAFESYCDEWYERPHNEIWDLGLEAITAREQQLKAQYGADTNWTYELKPEGFADLRFDWGLSAFDLVEICHRVERAGEVPA